MVHWDEAIQESDLERKIKQVVYRRKKEGHKRYDIEDEGWSVSKL